MLVCHRNVPAIKTLVVHNKVGEVNPNNVRRKGVNFSQPLLDCQIFFMLYSAHTNTTREREGLESRDIQERNSNQLSMLIHSHDTQGGGA